MLRVIVFNFLFLAIFSTAAQATCERAEQIALGTCQIKDSSDIVEFAQWQVRGRDALTFATVYEDYANCAIRTLGDQNQYSKTASYLADDVKQNDTRAFSARMSAKYAAGKVQIDKKKKTGQITYASYNLRGGFFTFRGSKRYGFSINLENCNLDFDRLAQ